MLIGDFDVFIVNENFVYEKFRLRWHVSLNIRPVNKGAKSTVIKYTSVEQLPEITYVWGKNWEILQTAFFCILSTKRHFFVF